MAGRPKGSVADRPRDYNKVIAIFWLRTLNYTWRDIGKIFDESQEGPFLLFKKWKEWARQNSNNGLYRRAQTWERWAREFGKDPERHTKMGPRRTSSQPRSER